VYKLCVVSIRRFNGFKFEAKQAIDAIAVRASYQGLHDVILLTNAVKNCSYLLNTGEKLFQFKCFSTSGISFLDDNIDDYCLFSLQISPKTRREFEFQWQTRSVALHLLYPNQ
jgi:hypothetical protein